MDLRYLSHESTNEEDRNYSGFQLKIEGNKRVSEEEETVGVISRILQRYGDQNVELVFIKEIDRF